MKTLWKPISNGLILASLWIGFITRDPAAAGMFVGMAVFCRMLHYEGQKKRD